MAIADFLLWALTNWEGNPPSKSCTSCPPSGQQHYHENEKWITKKSQKHKK